MDAEDYLLRVSRYIHLNPIKACLAKHPDKYCWSSCRFYSHNMAPPDWLYTNEILSRFGTKQQKNKYSLFVMEEADKELEVFYRKIKLSPILGSELFCKQIGQTILAKMPPTKDIPDQKSVCIRTDLVKICQLVAKYYHVSIESLHIVDRAKGNLPRRIAIYLAAELSDKKFGFIADFFKNISAAGVSQIVLRTSKLKTSTPSINNAITILSNWAQD